MLWCQDRSAGLFAFFPVSTLTYRVLLGASLLTVAFGRPTAEKDLSLFSVPNSEEDGLILAPAVRLLVDNDDSAARAELAALSATDSVLPARFVSMLGITIPGAKRPNFDAQ